MILLHQDLTDTSLLIIRTGHQTSEDLPRDLIPARNYTVTVHVAYVMNNTRMLALRTDSSCQLSFCAGKYYLK